MKRVVIETMEENEKRERQSNLVIYGVQESTQEIPQGKRKMKTSVSYHSEREPW